MEIDNRSGSALWGFAEYGGRASVGVVSDAVSDGSSQWKTFGERVIYDNPWVWLGQVDVELPGGERFWHHVVRLHRATMTVLVDKDDTITRRFKRLAKAAGLPDIDLHDVRHSYATAGRNAKIDWKALSKRIGHADVAFTMKQYVQTDLEADRTVANILADLIIGGLLVTEVEDQGDEST
jgi:hypothetical protein